jgi:hypothetical protein
MVSPVGSVVDNAQAQVFINRLFSKNLDKMPNRIFVRLQEPGCNAGTASGRSMSMSVNQHKMLKTPVLRLRPSCPSLRTAQGANAGVDCCGWGWLQQAKASGNKKIKKIKSIVDYVGSARR